MSKVGRFYKTGARSSFAIAAASFTLHPAVVSSSAPTATALKMSTELSGKSCFFLLQTVRQSNYSVRWTVSPCRRRVAAAVSTWA